MNRLIIYILGVLALTSCSKNFSRFSTTSPDKFNLNNLDYEYLSLKSKIRFEGEDDKQRATANIRIKRDSIIWYSITPGLGIEAVRGIITKDSILAIDKINKEYVAKAIGEYTEKIPFSFDLRFLESILVGNLIWPVNNEDQVTKSKGFYMIPKKYQTMTITNFIGSTSMKLERMQAESDTSAQSVQINYSAFQEFEGKDIPTVLDMHIKYISLKDNTQKISNITIEHAKVEIDKRHKFSFSIPKKYTRK